MHNYNRIVLIHIICIKLCFYVQFVKTINIDKKIILYYLTNENNNVTYSTYFSNMFTQHIFRTIN